MSRETGARRAERQTMYEAYINSGQKMAEFSRARGIAIWKVRDWIKKTRKEQQAASGFQEVTFPAVNASSYSVKLSNGLGVCPTNDF